MILLSSVNLRGGGGGGGGGGEGLRPFTLKKIYKLGVGGEGQDTSRHFKGSFGSIRALLSMLVLGVKTATKSELKVMGLSYCHYSICLKKTSI